MDEKNEEEKNVKLEVRKSKIKSVIFHIVAIICISLYAMAIAPKTLQNDTFYTITIGEYIYNNGISDLTTDLYSWHELPYTYPHWLYDLCMFMVYNAGGQLGIYISTLVLTALLGISVYVLCNKKSGNRLVSAALTIGALYLVKGFVAARAQLVTFILFTWTVYCIESFIEKKKLRYAILLVLIPLLIANLHCAVFPFYFILFLPYIGEFIICLLIDADLDFKATKIIFGLLAKLSKDEVKKAEFTEKKEKLAKRIADRKLTRPNINKNPYKIVASKNFTVLLLISVMCIAAFTGLLNPAGDGAYTYLVKTVQGNTTASINEHLPLVFVENTEFAVAVVVFLLILIFTDTKIKLHDLFMLAGIGYLSFKSRRQVSMFSLFCIPILANLIADLVAKYDRETFKKLDEFVTGWFGTTVVICLFIIWTSNIARPTIQSDYIDFGAYPVEAATWINENLDVENIRLYNEYNFGSYLLFRKIPVFIDSRCDLYSPEFNGTYNKEKKEYEGRDIFSDALNIAGVAVNYETKFEEYGVTHIIVYDSNKLGMVLESDPKYSLLFSDGRFKIFERLNANAPKTETVVNDPVVEN